MQTNQTLSKDFNVPQVTLWDLKWSKCEGFSMHFEMDSVHVVPHMNRKVNKEGIVAVKSSNKLNRYQNFLYERALYGLGAYEAKEIRQMHPGRKSQILEVSERAWQVINLFKQRVMNKIVNHWFIQLMGENYIHNKFASESPEPDPEFRCKLDFQQLGIRKRHLLDLLVSEGILPHNFFELTLQDDNRLIKLRSKTEALDA